MAPHPYPHLQCLQLPFRLVILRYLQLLTQNRSREDVIRRYVRSVSFSSVSVGFATTPFLFACSSSSSLLCSLMLLPTCRPWLINKVLGYGVYLCFLLGVGISYYYAVCALVADG